MEYLRYFIGLIQVGEMMKESEKKERIDFEKGER